MEAKDELSLSVKDLAEHFNISKKVQQQHLGHQSNEIENMHISIIPPEQLTDLKHDAQSINHLFKAAERFRSIFMTGDADGSGSVNVEEFKQIFQSTVCQVADMAYIYPWCLYPRHSYTF